MECRDQPCQALLGRRDGIERQLVQALRVSRKIVGGRTILHAQGEESPLLGVLFDGWAYIHRGLPDGRSHLVEVLMPGDIVPLLPDAGPISLIAAETATTAALCVFTREEVARFIARDRVAATALDTLRIAIFDRLLDQQARLSASSAEERLCHLLLGVYRRSRARGLTGPRGRCALPLSQSLLASACGLAPGNVNRILSVLRQAGILIFDRGAMQVLNEGLLAQRAGMAEDAQNALHDAEPAIPHSAAPWVDAATPQGL